VLESVPTVLLTVELTVFVRSFTVDETEERSTLGSAGSWALGSVEAADWSSEPALVVVPPLDPSVLDGVRPECATGWLEVVGPLVGVVDELDPPLVEAL
jgi:hypothetical protein